jgi:hypothetical protein
MRIMLKLVLDCDADAAWRALHSPRAVADLYGPFVELAPMAAEGLPLRLEPGADVPVRMSVAGRIGLGQQLIHVSERHVDDANGPVRIFRDSGIPLTGPSRPSMSGTTRWPSPRAGRSVSHALA